MTPESLYRTSCLIPSTLTANVGNTLHLHVMPWFIFMSETLACSQEVIIFAFTQRHRQQCHASCLADQMLRLITVFIKDRHWTRVYASRIPSPSSNPTYLTPTVESNIIIQMVKALYVFRPNFFHISRFHMR